MNMLEMLHTWLKHHTKIINSGDSNLDALKRKKGHFEYFSVFYEKKCNFQKLYLLQYHLQFYLLELFNFYFSWLSNGGILIPETCLNNARSDFEI